jgi:hypothetical protein
MQQEKIDHYLFRTGITGKYSIPDGVGDKSQRKEVSL